MTDSITTTVSFSDLAGQYDSELDDLRDAHNELVSHALEEYGDDGHEWPESVRATIDAYEAAGKQIQRRQHSLDQLTGEYDDGTFTLAMLSGADLMEIETDLRVEARERDADVNDLQALRQQLTVDAATVDAPAGVPTGDDGSPLPSECPSPLTLSLYDQVERLNTAGAVDFRAPGFEAGTSGVASPSSDRPTSSGTSSSVSAPTDGASPPRGDSS